METDIARIEESEYGTILLRAVALIDETRTTAAKTLNSVTNTAYWKIGQLLHEKKLDSRYGSQIVKRLSADLKKRYPTIRKSPRKLWYKKTFYERYAVSDEKVQRSVALLPWSHNTLILSKELNDEQTVFYAEQVISKGWNRDLLMNALKMEMHKQLPTKSADNNFASTLPSTQAEYANEVFRDNYNLGFIGATEPLAELELERRLVEKIKYFL